MSWDDYDFEPCPLRSLYFALARDALRRAFNSKGLTEFVQYIQDATAWTRLAVITPPDVIFPDHVGEEETPAINTWHHSGRTIA